MARDCGYAAVEFDVKLSADNVLMLMHDDTLERTTNGRGLFREHTAAALEQLDAGAWRDAKWTAEMIPRFDATMAFLNAAKMTANIEIKPCAARDVETGRAVGEATLALFADDQPLPVLSSFSVPALRAAMKVAPSLPRGLLVERYDRSLVALARELGCVSLNCAWTDVDPVMLAALHDSGLRVLTYTVNDVALAARLFELGVDGIFTDALDDMRRAFPETYFRNAAAPT